VGEIPWDKVRSEIFSMGGCCVSTRFDGKVSMYSCWLCGATSKRPCRVSNLSVQAGSKVARDWLMMYAEQRERCRG